MSLTDAPDERFEHQSMIDRFETFGSPLPGRRRIQRMVDHKTERYVAVRRLEGPIDPDRVTALLELRDEHLFPLLEALRDDETPYLVGDFGEVSLADRLGKGPFAEGDLLGIAQSVGQAMKVLHDRGFFPIDPTPEMLWEARDGSVKVAAVTLPVSDAEATAPGGEDPIRYDIRTLGRTLLALARGRNHSDESDLSSVPGSLAPVVEKCLFGKIHDAGELLAALGISRPAAARRRREEEPGAQPEDPLERGGAGADEETTTAHPSERTATDTMAPDAPTEEPDAELEPLPRRARAPDTADGSREDQPRAFPWRPVEEAYRIEGEALEGGMGSVRMAIEKATGRKVAIKRILVDSGMRQSSLDRFYREAHSIANLSHPHILQLLQPGRDEQGDYLVLEWAAGGSLKEKIVKQGKLPPDEVMQIARKIGSALQYAHEKGVVHRDIKPHNILLTETGEPKLADFGLARSMEDYTLTSSKGGAGSPLYMPPEQQESSREADARSDLYSFGKTLYQLLTGKPPTNPDPKLLPPRMRKAIMRCMEEDPARRPQSAREFLRELEGRTPVPLVAYAAAAAAAVVLALAVAYAMDLGPFGGRGGGEDPGTGDPIQAHDEPTGPENDPGEAGGGGTPSIHPVLAGMVALIQGAKGQGEAVEPGGETVASEVELQIGFRGGDPALDEQSITLTRNGAPVEGARVERRDGRVYVTAPLAEGENRFAIDLGNGFAPVETRIVRTVPIPSVTRIGGSTPDTGAHGFRTREDRVEIEGSLSEPLESLFLACVDADLPAVEVPVRNGAFRASLELPREDGTYHFEWRWPDAEPRNVLAQAPRISVLVDRTPPVVRLDEPELDAQSLYVSGDVQDKNPGETVEVVVEGPDRESRRVTVPVVDGLYRDEVRLPSDLTGREGELVVRAAFTDVVGNRSEPAVRTVRFDRKAPELIEEPEVTRQGSTVTIAGRASEPLERIRCGGRDGVVSEDGESFTITGVPLNVVTHAYELAFADRGGNETTSVVTRAFEAAGPVAVAPDPPKVKVELRDQGNQTLAVVTSDSPLMRVRINGRDGTPSGGAFHVTIPIPLADLRDPLWGPTHDPLKVYAEGADGGVLEQDMVALPSTVFGRPQPSLAIPLDGDPGYGTYCPYAATEPGHKVGGRRNGVPRDWFVPPGNRCGRCQRAPGER